MANLIYAITASLDGYIADENGSEDPRHPARVLQLALSVYLGSQPVRAGQ